jgi:hypothetical protein
MQIIKSHNMHKNILRLILSIFCLSLTSCGTNKLVVQTKYFSHEDLASFYVDTPDPLQNNPPVGQSLLIFWNLGKDFCKYTDISVHFIIRLKDKTEIEKSFQVTLQRGYYTYSLFNDDYFNSRGIATYKAELIADGIVIDEWRQHLWKELILFEKPSLPCEEDDEI